MTWHFVEIKSPEEKALDVCCVGSASKFGYGDGFEYGDACGDGGGIFEGEDFDGDGSGDSPVYADGSGSGFGCGHGYENGDGYGLKRDIG